MNRPRAGFTAGDLPLAAFEHTDPTAVGVVDLDTSLEPRFPGGGDTEARDCLLLLRLHQEPLGVVHLDHPFRELDRSQFARRLWDLAREPVVGHLSKFGCSPVPNGAEEFTRCLESLGPDCASLASPHRSESVAAVVCTAGRADQLELCLHSLAEQRDVEAEILVVDNRPAASDARETVAKVVADGARIRYVADERPGLSIARNRALAETSADLIAFTDDDVVVEPSWLRWLVAPFADARVSASSGLVLPLELETPSQKSFEEILGFSKGVTRRPYDRSHPQTPDHPLYPFLVDALGIGASTAFRRKDLLAAGGFDPALGAGSPARAGEETDAFSALLLRGGRVVYEPRSLCWHLHRRDGEALEDQVFGYGVGVGALLAKALVSRPSFYPVALRALPIFARRAVMARQGGTGTPAAPPELAQARRRGLVRGPLRYAQAIRRARRMGVQR